MQIQQPRDRRRRWWWVVAAVAAVVLLVGAGLYIGGNRRGTTTGTAVSSSSAPASSVVTGPQLQEMWSTQPAVCKNLVTADNKPANKLDDPDNKPDDPDKIMGDIPWPDGSDIVAKLGTMSSPGAPKFIRDRMRYLTIITLRSQSNRVNEVNQGTDAIGAAKDTFRRGVQSEERDYIEARDHTLMEIAEGHPISNAKVEAKYQEKWVCPNG